MQPMKSTKGDAFELDRFLPYLLNQAAERVGKGFERAYRDPHGLSRTQWRILAHLAAQNAMTAADISRRAQTEKSKISRAVAAMVDRGLLTRTPDPRDGRIELLTLTGAGHALHERLAAQAIAYDAALRARLDAADLAALERALLILNASPPA